MLRRFAAIATVLFLFGGILLAGEYRGMITKAEGDKITIKVRKDKDDKEGTDKTFKVSADAKFAKAKGKDASEDLSKEEFMKAVEKGVGGKAKGVFATVTTEGDGENEKVTKAVIRTGGGKGKGKDKDK